MDPDLLEPVDPDMDLGRHIFAYKFFFIKSTGLDTDTVPDPDSDPDV